MMRKWWQSLVMRERLMIGGGAIFIILLLFYIFILNPLNNAITHLQDDIDTQRSLLDWMQPADTHILQLRRAGFSANHLSTHQEALLVLVERKLNDAKLNRYLQRTQQPQNNTLIMYFHQVPFDDLMRCLQDLSRQTGIQVQQFNAQRSEPTGTVNANITVQQ